MTIVLKHKKRPVSDCTDWSIETKSLNNGRHGYLCFSACVTYKKLGRKSRWFEATFDSTANHLSLHSSGYEWSGNIPSGNNSPNDIIIAALKQPIFVSVMYGVGCDSAHQYKIMNDYFGRSIFQK